MRDTVFTPHYCIVNAEKCVVCPYLSLFVKNDQNHKP